MEMLYLDIVKVKTHLLKMEEKSNLSMASHQSM